MKITREDVRRAAVLARISLSVEEEERLVADLDGILAHVAKLSEVATDDVPPMAHVLDSAGGLRDDLVRNPPAAESLVSGAPDRSGDFFRVPKIIE